jgi:hypothetical protein
MTKTNPKYKLVNLVTTIPVHRTYIVLGLGRSGTSFIASVLGYLGIFCGDKVTPASREDLHLTAPIEANDFMAASKVIENYNERHNVWAFKRPSMVGHAAATEKLFRNPHYIFTHRDFFALALRNEIAISRDIAQSLRNSMASSKHLYAFMESTTAPCLHLSFELTNAAPLQAAEIIRDFVLPEQAGKPIDADAFQAFIDESRRVYLAK